MISPQDLEELRNYFQPVTETGTSLPAIGSVIDNTMFVLKNSDGTKDLYVATEGAWKLVSANIGG